MKRKTWWIPAALGGTAAVAVWAAVAGLPWTGASTQPAAADTDAVVLSEDQLAQAMAIASPAEFEVLADGRLTYDEYRFAIDGSIACLKERGFRVVHYADHRQGVLVASLVKLASAVEGSVIGDDGLVTYSATGGPTGSPEENGRIAADCRRKSELVERLWEGHLDATPTAPAGQRIEALAACLRASGVSVPEQPDEHQLREIVGVRMQDGVPQAPSEAVLRAWTSCETQLSVPR